MRSRSALLVAPLAALTLACDTGGAGSQGTSCSGQDGAICVDLVVVSNNVVAQQICVDVVGATVAFFKAPCTQVGTAGTCEVEQPDLRLTIRYEAPAYTPETAAAACEAQGGRYQAP